MELNFAQQLWETVVRMQQLLRRSSKAHTSCLDSDACEMSLNQWLLHPVESQQACVLSRQ